MQCDRDRAAGLLPTFDLVVPLMTRLDAAALAAGGAGRLRQVLQYGVGLEGVDAGAASAAGVAVSNIPSSHTPNAVSCAEMALFLALAVLRRAPECAASLASRRLGAPPGRTLAGKRALVVGFGGIARELIPRLVALGVTVDGVRRSAWSDAPAPGSAEGLLRRQGAWADLHAFAGGADLCFLACAEVGGGGGRRDLALRGEEG